MEKISQILREIWLFKGKTVKLGEISLSVPQIKRGRPSILSMCAYYFTKIQTSYSIQRLQTLFCFSNRTDILNIEWNMTIQSKNSHIHLVHFNKCHVRPLQKKGRPSILTMFAYVFTQFKLCVINLGPCAQFSRLNGKDIANIAWNMRNTLQLLPNPNFPCF